MSTQTGWPLETSPFHTGERAVQKRVGVLERIDGIGRRVVRDHLPDQHREFFTELPMIFTAHVSDDGWPWASVLVGGVGSISTPDKHTLRVAAVPLSGDPLKDGLHVGAPLGFVGMGLSNRRRNRMNGEISRVDPSGIEVSVTQSFGNCPKYIKTRVPSLRRAIDAPSGPVEHIDILDDAAQDLIARAETFFVASASANALAHDKTRTRGADMSHRGGKPGFVKVAGNTLTIPDFPGNQIFNTLGNFFENPRAGLLFIDYATGDILMVSGTVDIVWDGPEVAAFQGAERLWRVTVRRVIRLRDAMPIVWEEQEPSPNSLSTGNWDQASQSLAASAKRAGWRTFRVARIEDESSTIRSFYLKPDDGEGLFDHRAGQYLPLKVTPGGQGKPVVRTYTITSLPTDDHYRISVKREDAGLVSQHLHDSLIAGDVVQVRAPAGSFSLDTAENRPALLISGGVGVTPLVAMVRQIAFDGQETGRVRPVTIITGSRNTKERAFHHLFQQLAQGYKCSFKYVSVLSQPSEIEKRAKDYDALGRITADLLHTHVPLDDYEVYLCGPQGFMQDVYDALRTLGLRDARIFAESFGPAGLKRTKETPEPIAPQPQEAEQTRVTFRKSGIEHAWVKGDPPLLDVAEASGMTPEYGCRGGTCGSCAVKLTQGEVVYRTEPTAPRAPGEVLICCAVPAEGSERIELDL